MSKRQRIKEEIVEEVQPVIEEQVIEDAVVEEQVVEEPVADEVNTAAELIEYATKFIKNGFRMKDVRVRVKNAFNVTDEDLDKLDIFKNGI